MRWGGGGWGGLQQAGRGVFRRVRAMLCSCTLGLQVELDCQK